MEKHRIIKFTIGRKIFLCFLALSLAPILILGNLSYLVSRNQLNRVTEAHLKDLARDCGRKVSYYVASRYHDIKMLAQADVLEGSNDEKKQKYIEEIIEAYPYYIAITVIDKNGKIIACTMKELISKSRADRSWFKKALNSKQGDVISIDVYKAETAGSKIAIGFNAPVMDEANIDVIGVVTTRIKMDHIIARVQMLDTRTAGGNHAYLLNRHGKILAGPDEKDFLTFFRLCDYPVVKDLLAGRTGISKYENDRGEAVISARYALKGDGDFNGWGWGIIVTEPESKVFSAAYMIRNAMIMMAFSATLVITLFAVFISRSFSRPIQKMSESVVRISQGDLKPIKIKYGPKDEIGELVGAFNKMTEDLHATTVSRDLLANEIVEREQAEVALRESEEKYRTMIEQSNDMIWTLEREGNFTFFNRRFEEISGYRFDDWQDKSFASFVVEEDLPVVTNIFRRTLSKESLHYEVRILNYNRKILVISVNTAPILKAGKVVGTVGFGRDITERKLLEKRLRRAERIEAIGALSSGIAHDFNNILTAIICGTELALYQIPERSPVRRNLKQVLDASDRAKDLVNQILAFSRQDDQKPKPVQIGPIIKKSFKLLRASLPATIEIRKNIKTMSDTILADATQICQVLMNFCTNAAHAMQDNGGVLEISLENVDIDAGTAAQYPDLKAGSFLRLAVSDTGHGINPEIKDQIFDPFFTTKELSGGTGIGLAVVYRIVKSCGGAIKVKSEPGKGSVFQTFFPSFNEAITPETEVFEPIPGGSEQILFVDDEQVLAKMGQNILQHLGYKVVAKTSSLEVLEIFRARPDRFDLVITDQTMPHMTGKTLARKLVQIRKNIPIILCTGLGKAILEERDRAAGIREIVTKPFVIRQLAQSIRRALD